MRIAVTGGNGCLGSVVIDRLLSSGYQVRALFRAANERSKSFEERGVEMVYGNLLDQAALENLVVGTEQVIHCAALTKETSMKKMRATNVLATLNLARTASHAGVSHFIHLSTAAVYGEQAGSYDETSPLEMKALVSRYSQTKLEAEQGLRELAADDKLKVTILRPTVIYGPGSSWTEDPLRLLARGIPLCPRKPGSVGDFVYVDDVARAIFLSLFRRETWGKTFNISGFEMRWEDYYEIYGGLLGKASRRLPSFFPLLAALIPSLRLYRNIIEERRAYPREKAKAILGFEPQIDSLFATDLLEDWLRSSPQKLESLKPKFRTLVRSQTFFDFRPCRIVRPTNEEDVQRTIEYARLTGRKIRCRGAMHSFAPLYATEDILLDLSRLKGIVEMGADWVRVRGGTILSELMGHLSSQGKCLTTHGAIKVQTVAGALSTGTHGCSLQHGSLSGKIREMVVIDGQGNRRVFGARNAQLPLAQIALGCIGVITEVVLEIADKFLVEETTQSGKLSDLLNRMSLREIFRREEYGYLFLYPRIGAYAHTTYRRTTQPKRKLVHKTKCVRPIEILAGKIGVKLLASDGLFGRFLRWAIKLKLLYLGFPKAVGELAGIMSTEMSEGSREYPVWDISIAIPESRADEALKDLMALLNPSVRRLRYHAFLAPMVQIRPQGAEKAPLSASYLENRVWFEIWIDKRVPFESWKEFLADLHRFFEPYDYRIHWGKNVPLDREHLARVYPEMGRFLSFCDEMDPLGLFQSRYLAVLGETQRRFDKENQNDTVSKIH